MSDVSGVSDNGDARYTAFTNTPSAESRLLLQQMKKMAEEIKEDISAKFDTLASRIADVEEFVTIENRFSPKLPQAQGDSADQQPVIKKATSVGFTDDFVFSNLSRSAGMGFSAPPNFPDKAQLHVFEVPLSARLEVREPFTNEILQYVYNSMYSTGFFLERVLANVEEALQEVGCNSEASAIVVIQKAFREHIANTLLMMELNISSSRENKQAARSLLLQAKPKNHLADVAPFAAQLRKWREVSAQKAMVRAEKAAVDALLPSSSGKIDGGKAFVQGKRAAPSVSSSSAVSATLGLGGGKRSGGDASGGNRGRSLERKPEGSVAGGAHSRAPSNGK